MADEQDQIARIYALCKMQAVTDGAVDEPLLQHWFEAAFDLCAEEIGLIFPAQEIAEPIALDHRGSFHLSHQPSSEVRIFAGYTLLMVLPPSLERSWCDPSLCCHCNLTAHYTVGRDLACSRFPPRFVQAVCRVFTYLVSNRGEMPLDKAILGSSGALAFLSPDVLYVA
jgi:hypothetical protein